ncbi:hypothetical protein [Xanthomonas sp. GPE 39]|uniref:hypothetical protein n=1 Tax=Xanthomonas sp. GPE 39 TaxID=1583099 RepID=UPI001F204BDE|nr:hypothetical protein [Xanthomonas sp. GPE 39]
MKPTLSLLALFLSLSAGCSMSHGDPKNPKHNPHPVKRYEVIATADAPGPWDSVKGYLEYKVSNQECTPEDKFLGVHVMPPIVGQDFEMTRIDEKTWKGYFYRDFMQDEDYYGLGDCHWEPASVSTVFVGNGVAFDPGAVFEQILRNGQQTEYFKKSSYGDKALVRYGAQNYSIDDIGVIQNPGDYFKITMAIKEVRL